MRAAPLPPPRFAHDAHRDVGEDEQAEDPRREAHVDLHVAIEDVAELMADHGLQLVAVELVERALRHGHGGFIRGVAGGEGVDARLIRQHEDLRLADASGDGHLFDDVQQALALQIALRPRSRARRPANARRPRRRRAISELLCQQAISMVPITIR